MVFMVNGDGIMSEYNDAYYPSWPRFVSKDEAVRYAEKNHKRFVYEVTAPLSTFYFAWNDPSYDLDVVYQGW
ncbi:hypothetical protein Bphyt_7310 (plasmid) [Paraburkholderia phytofirmans PsJN]|uniref:Uncharacterized protein n=2 Tax=Paraburkholderia phytofirmans TaxID=261302 RepID=B2TH46_PARPJ|nr:hypothetical protein Bphyt_7310 [Paraburkholderia phytofirmans PsJN]